jgi:hypothetical protein
MFRLSVEDPPREIGDDPIVTDPEEVRPMVEFWSEALGTLETVSAPEELVRPVPSRLLNDDPLTMRLVVLAVAKDE